MRRRISAPASSAASSPLLVLLIGTTCLPTIVKSYEMIPCPGIQVGSVETGAKKLIRDPADGKNGACVCVPSNQYNITCPAGFYCPPEGGQFECTRGFYCPVNVSQPTYCCEGHYCPTASEMKICPEGNYCPNAVVNPISCGSLTSCKEGTYEIRSRGPLIAVIVIFAILLVGNHISLYTYKWKQQRHVKHIREWARRPELLTEADHDKSVLEQQDKDSNANEDTHAEAEIGKTKTGANHDAREWKGDTKSPGLKSPADAGTAAAVSETDSEEPSLEIVFKDISFVLPNGKVIMKGVNGIFRKGRSMAVMGPSGAGKSTLFNLVMGKAKRTTGTVELNGKPDELFNYGGLVGFVPQEDVMLRRLTVYDILRFSSNYRLPASYSHRQRREAVLSALKFLEIDHVVNSVIGDEKMRGISGGQRKRVNIGMELVANPRVLFLDEPTSGLDAVTSQTLASLLRDLARSKGIVVAAVIHSPSRETFELFDDLTLLGAGGRMIYQGAVDRAPEYFKSIGFPVPPDVNPADFYLEVAMGKIPQKLDVKEAIPEEKERVDGGEAEIGRPFDPTKLFALWYERGADFRPEGLKHLVDPDKDNGDEKRKGDAEEGGTKKSSALDLWLLSVKEYWEEIWEEFHQFVICHRSEKARATPNYFRIFYWCCQRTYYQIYRDGSWIKRLFLHVGLGLFLSVMGTDWFIGPLPGVTCETSPTAQLQTCVLPLQDNFVEIGTFSTWAISFAGMVEGINTFGLEQVVFWRHASRGLPTIPYFIAKVLMDLPIMVLSASLFYLGMTFGYTSVGNSDHFYGFIFFNYWVGYSMGYLLSVVAEPRYRPLYSVLFAMMWAVVFSGAIVLLGDVKHKYSAALAWLWDISFTRYGVESFYVNELAFYQDYMVGLENALKLRKYKKDHIPLDFGAMFGIGLFWQFITFLLMKLLNRDKQH